MKRREVRGAGGRGVDPQALVTRSRNRVFFSPWLRSVPRLPRSPAPGLGRQHRAREQERGQEDGEAAVHPPRGDRKEPAGGPGGAPDPPHPHGGRPLLAPSPGKGARAAAAAPRHSRLPRRPAQGLTTATRGPIPGAGLSRSCPWWEVSAPPPPLPPLPPRLGPPARCKERRRSRCIPAAPERPPPAPCPPPGRASPRPPPPTPSPPCGR